VKATTRIVTDRQTDRHTAEDRIMPTADRTV